MKQEDLKFWDEMSENYNTLRSVNNGKRFSKKELVKVLTVLPSVGNFTSIYVEHGLIVRLPQYGYTLPSQPIMWHEVKNAVLAVKAKISEYNHRHEMKKSKVEENPIRNKIKQFLQDSNITISDLANYLVQTGNYQIKERVEEWKTI